jgi:hypothetical protein
MRRTARFATGMNLAMPVSFTGSGDRPPISSIPPDGDAPPAPVAEWPSRPIGPGREGPRPRSRAG